MTSKINFRNNLGMPIIVEYWYKSRYISTTIDTNDVTLLESDVCEWHLSAMFKNNEKEKTDQWKEFYVSKGDYYHNAIGKFRNNPAADGNYCWLFVDNLILNYENDIIELNYA